MAVADDVDRFSGRVIFTSSCVLAVAGLVLSAAAVAKVHYLPVKAQGVSYAVVCVRRAPAPPSGPAALTRACAPADPTSRAWPGSCPQSCSTGTLPRSTTSRLRFAAPSGSVRPRRRSLASGARRGCSRSAVSPTRLAPAGARVRPVAGRAHDQVSALSPHVRGRAAADASAPPPPRLWRLNVIYRSTRAHAVAGAAPRSPLTRCLRRSATAAVRDPDPGRCGLLGAAGVRGADLRLLRERLLRGPHCGRRRLRLPVRHLRRLLPAAHPAPSGAPLPRARRVAAQLTLPVRDGRTGVAA